MLTLHLTLRVCVYLGNRFSLVQKHTVEFNQLAMANSEGSEVMLNRVMTKDNIGVAVLLELRKEMIEQSGLYLISCSPFHPCHFACLLLANLTDKALRV